MVSRLVLALLAVTLLARADERVRLAEGWRLQPATTVAVAPDPDKWVALDGLTRYWGGALRRVWPEVKGADIGSIWYEQTLAIPADWAGSRVLVDCHRLEGDAVVLLNGQRLGELRRPGGEFELTPAVNFGGANVLGIFLTRSYTDISRDFAHDPLRYATRGPHGRDLPMGRWGLAISAPVDLIRRPTPAAVAGIFVKTSWRTKTLTVDVDVEAIAAVPGARLEIAVTDAAGKEVLATAATLDLPAGSSTQTVATPWQDPVPWELDGPYLYTLTLRLRAADKLLDSTTQRFGFREVWTEGRHVYLNGHVSRWRLEWTAFGINANSISFLKLLGRNVLYAQNNPTAWWCDWPETPYYDDDLLDLLDASGIGLLLPAPSISHIRDLLLHDTTARADFQREMALWVRRYRNRPCILAWCIAMNSFNPRDGIHPDTLGTRVDYSHPQARALADAAEIVRADDPTRLVYAHADGNLTDIASANVYPNFAPLQEVEDWPEMWADRGDMPFVAAEYALPYDGSFFNKQRFLGTEFAAIYFGNAAYAAESDTLLRRTAEIGAGNRGHGNIPAALPDFPMYWTLRSLYVTRSDRAWRTWGVLAWHYFNFGVGYGDPPGAKINRFSRYSVLAEPVTGRPDWANPNFDMNSVHMQSLLAYLGGSPVFTDKTHGYYAGDRLEKQVVVVWDGPGDRNLAATWTLRQGDRLVRTGTVPVPVHAGDVAMKPIVADLPDLGDRVELSLDLEVTEAGRTVATDTFPIQVFRRAEPRPPTARIAIWDPRGKTGWLQSLGIRPTAFGPDTDLLVVGREAITPGVRLPWTPADLERGLQVLILAQRPEMWEALGLRPDDLMTRRVFPNVAGHPVLAGLEPADLWDWRGSPDLLPAFKREFGHDGQRAPRSSNRGTVASVVLRLPDVPGFTPILNGEFDLDYSPLLHCRAGRGALWFCTLDFAGRVGVEPGATRLAANLLRAAATPPPAPPAVTLVTDSTGLARETREIVRATPPTGPLFAGIGPRLLRWRQPLTVQAFTADTAMADGLFLLEGDRLHTALSPDLLADSRDLGWQRLRQLDAQLRTNLGAAAAPDVVARLCELRAGPAYETLKTWQVFGPFYPEPGKPDTVVDTAFPGEENAIAGDTNPNFTYPTADGRKLDFRATATAGPNGFVDLSAVLEPDRQAVAYATRTVTSDTAREAVLRLGVDYFMQVWVNGQVVYRVVGGHGAPQANRHQVKIPLEAGANVITVKVFAGSKGFGFWANLATGNAAAEDTPAVALYPEEIDAFDPYEYHYW